MTKPIHSAPPCWKVGIAAGLLLLGGLLAGCQSDTAGGPPVEKTTPPAARFNKSGQRMQAPPPGFPAK